LKKYVEKRHTSAPQTAAGHPPKIRNRISTNFFGRYILADDG
jgi:hypothetical protein